MRRSGLAAAAVAAVLLAGCEPAVDLALPPREPDQVVLDQADILSDAVEQRLRALGSQGRDVVALTYETEQAGRGEASRAARLLLERWDADVALVAVARPGDFTSTADGRDRFFGLDAADTRAIPRARREEIVESLVPPIAGRNNWDGAFLAALDHLAEG
jgi:hypothetical protein